MGTYYFLLNDTKRQRVHLANHIKRGPITSNNAVQFAFINYMMCNQGDAMRLCGDGGYDGINYSDTDLLTYKWDDDTVLPEIVEMLNNIYGTQRYSIDGGLGVCGRNERN